MIFAVVFVLLVLRIEPRACTRTCIIFILRRGMVKLPYCPVCVPAFDSLASDSQSAGIIGVYHHAQLYL